MRHVILCISAVFCMALQPCSAAPTDEQVEARKIAIELAGAFSNDGFKLRDGHWDGQLTLGKGQLIQVNLYAGNEYWFLLGATAQAKKLAVNIFDEFGRHVEFEPYSEGQTAAAGFSPTISGPYYVEVLELEGEPAVFSLVYSYK